MANWKYIFALLFNVIFISEISCLSTIYLDEHCGQTINIFYSSRLKASRSSQLQRNLNCIVYAQGVVNEHVIAVFRNFDTLTGSRCSRNRLDIYHGHTTDPTYRLSGPNGICGYITSSREYLTNSSQIMTFQFTTDSTYQTGSFDIVLTSYHVGPCHSGEFRCLNNRCIDDDLTCDGYNHCGDNSSQLSCAVVLGVGIIVAIVFGALIFVICLPLIIVCFVCKKLSGNRYNRF